MVEYNVLHTGGGIPSTVLHLMFFLKEIKVRELDCVIFPDTGAESAPLYRHLELLHSFAGPYNHTACRGKLGHDLLPNRQLLDGLPTHSSKSSSPACQLTKEYKLKVLIGKIRETLGLKKGQPFPHRQISVALFLAVTYDERRRAELIRQRLAEYPWIKPVFPLIAHEMTLWHCRHWLRNYGKLPLPVPHSGCVFCPFRSNKDWQWLRKNDPQGFAVAVEVDRNLRLPDSQPIRPRFLHHSGIPLFKAKLDVPESNEAKKHLDFHRECEGLCGL